MFLGWEFFIFFGREFLIYGNFFGLLWKLFWRRNIIWQKFLNPFLRKIFWGRNFIWQKNFNPLDYLIFVSLACMLNFIFLGYVQVLFPWWKKKKRKKIISFRGYLSPAQIELSWVWAGVGLRLTNYFHFISFN